MKKLSTALILVCLAIPAFAGGGGQKAGGGKLVFWDKSEFVQAYNQNQKARFEAFCKANNIEGEYVIVPQNDIKSKVLAAIEAKNPPDIVVVDGNQGKQYAAMGQLADVSDVYGKVKFTKAALSVSETDNGQFIIPIAMFPAGLYLRKDVWDAHGLPDPKTWDDVYNHAKIVNDPKNNFYALGYPMGASGGGDADSMVRACVMGFGGVVVDKNMKVTVNSPQTLAALNFIVKLYKEGLCPPDAVTWDDMGNNVAYEAGSVGIIHNTMSVFSKIRTDKPDLFAKTKILPIPGGPAGQFLTASGSAALIFKNGKQTEMAKKFMTEFFEMDYYTKLVEAIGGMWVPTIEGAEKTPFWQDPIHKGFYDTVANAIGPGTWPAPDNELTAQISAEQTGVKAVQKILLQGMDPQQALDEWEAECKRILGQK